MKASAPPSTSAASRSVMPSPTITMVSYGCLSLKSRMTSGFPPCLQVGSVRSNPAKLRGRPVSSHTLKCILLAYTFSGGRPRVLATGRAISRKPPLMRYTATPLSRRAPTRSTIPGFSLCSALPPVARYRSTSSKLGDKIFMRSSSERSRPTDPSIARVVQASTSFFFPKNPARASSESSLHTVQSTSKHTAFARFHNSIARGTFTPPSSTLVEALPLLPAAFVGANLLLLRALRPALAAP
mmetsp:Transcript_4993/g.17520  ORF Transcript_4993/g.17520 Transcript_4993/m.17520 type:complete len:241 (-) Transcript_4993:105-827(-)